MKYPKVLRKTNGALAFFSGCLIFLIGAFAVLEAILRGVFSSPTKWTLNLSCYMLVYIVFLSSPYAFETHGHVLVDLFRDLMDKAWPNRIPRKVCAVIGYLMSVVFIGVIFYATWRMLMKAIRFSTLTTTTIPIPIWILYVPMLLGCVIMVITLIFLILDILSGSEEFI